MNRFQKAADDARRRKERKDMNELKNVVRDRAREAAAHLGAHSEEDQIKLLVESSRSMGPESRRLMHEQLGALIMGTIVSSESVLMTAIMGIAAGLIDPGNPDYATIEEINKALGPAGVSTDGRTFTGVTIDQIGEDGKRFARSIRAINMIADGGISEEQARKIIESMREAGA